jgi:sugar phosphate isomerase/epimerase
MRFGICAPPDQAADLSAEGYDYVEWPLSRSAGVFDDDQYADLRRLAAQLPVRPEAWNVMLPARIVVVGPEADHDAMRDYVEVAFARVADLHGTVVVLGSGASRRVPVGFARDDALAQFAEACTIAGEVAEKNGITIAIEPLNRNETNLVNSVSEGAEIVRHVAHPTVRLLSDLYHVSVEREPLSDTADAGDLLAHVHVAAPDRRIPLPGHGEQELRDYFLTLRAAEYDGRVSIEARWNGIDEAGAGLRLMQETWASL